MLPACCPSLLRRILILRSKCRHAFLYNNFCQYSSKSGAYSHTLKMIKTDFPISSHNSVYEREADIQKRFQFDNLYEWQSRQNQPNNFVLHDGPPYANGHPHIGHALNKILKDITNRYKLLRNYKINFVPGWDCHGMPIEQKALANVTDNEHLNPLTIRKVAKDFAEGAANDQKRAFKKWGVMADWENNCYYTLNPKYETDQLEAFFNLYEKGFISQRYMPVFWSPTSRSALAEAEVEYNDNFESTQVYVKLPFVKHPTNWSSEETFNKIFAVIWTTTPWTLPLNKFICYSEGIRYCLLKDQLTNDGYVVSEKFKQDVCSYLGKDLKEVLSFTGDELQSSTYLSPSGSESPVLPAAHVTNDRGTGVVHGAPAHGVEDFQVALKNGLVVECHVDEEGRYDASVRNGLAGKFVLTEGVEEVLKIMSDAIIHQSKIKHSYPIDWRTKQPILYRASEQWFFDTEKIKGLVMESLNKVDFYPKGSKKGLTSELRSRNYWCISRQRSWGVPIPVFVDKNSKKPLLTRHSIDHLKKLFAEHGSDCWWKMSTAELLPSEIVEKSGCDSSASFERGKDILDIWFDSGVTWNHVLQGCDEKVADVYLEGRDQCGGWFLTSLLTSSALQGKAPFKKLLTHGFALDGEGKKMSKSLGNVVEPDDIIDGTEGKQAHGVDVLRMWAAQASLSAGVAVNDKALTELAGKLLKLRKTIRFLIGSLYDFNVEHARFHDNAICLKNDRYMLHLLQNFLEEVTKSYEDFNYSRVIRISHNFNVTDVSAMYLRMIKDRLYCGEAQERHSCQLVLFHILDVLTKVMAPITPHICEETYAHHPLSSVSSSIFKTLEWPSPDWSDPDLASVYKSVWPVRSAALSMLKTPGEFELTVHAEASLLKNLTDLDTSSQLMELFQVAEVCLCPLGDSVPTPTEEEKVHQGKGFTLVAKKSQNSCCLRCRRFVAERNEQLCCRCSGLVNP